MVCVLCRIVAERSERSGFTGPTTLSHRYNRQTFVNVELTVVACAASHRCRSLVLRAVGDRLPISPPLTDAVRSDVGVRRLGLLWPLTAGRSALTADGVAGHGPPADSSSHLSLTRQLWQQEDAIYRSEDATLRSWQAVFASYLVEINNEYAINIGATNIQCNAMQCNTMQYNTIQYNTIQYNTIQ